MPEAAQAPIVPRSTPRPAPRESLKGGGGTPPSALQPCLHPKRIPIPQHQPQPHFQPPVTAHPATAFTSPATAVQPLWDCPDRTPSPSSKALPAPLPRPAPRRPLHVADTLPPLFNGVLGLGGGGLGHKRLCTKTGPTRFSQWYISFFPAMVPLVGGGGVAAPSPPKVSTGLRERGGWGGGGVVRGPKKGGVPKSASNFGPLLQIRFRPRGNFSNVRGGGGSWRFEICIKNMEKRERAFGAPSKRGGGLEKGLQAPPPPRAKFCGSPVVRCFGI